MIDGKLYVVGGEDGNSTTLRSVECFDPSTGAWSVVAAMGTARCLHGVAVVDGKLYVVGGKDGTTLRSVECFDASTGWFFEDGIYANESCSGPSHPL